MPRRLPLFPLKVVLFPGAPMPLHVFEPRYRTMLADCLAGDERFGIVPVVDGQEDRPPPGAIGCVAHIRASQTLADGRSNIVVTGESRFILEEYLDEDVPYLVGRIGEIHDDDERGLPDEAQAELRRLCTGYLEALHSLNDSPPPEIDFPDDARSLSFQVSAALQLDLDAKLGLLSLRSTRERVRTLIRVLPVLIADLEERLQLHVHARGNGKGGRHARLEEDDG
ncbi:MAG: LON peptidase substrate-binding domain-containing protein [Gemmatimonadales bacterium]